MAQSNKEWLYSLDPHELTEWFDTEHESCNQHADQQKCEPVHETHKLDSREKLEADTTETWKAVARICARGETPKERWTNDEFYKLLDRQAAITERECRKHAIAYQCHCDEKFAELQKQVDKLTAERDNYRDMCVRAVDAGEQLSAKVDKLEECVREREHLRNQLGIALDHAHDICSLVDLDGNVLP